MATADLLAPVAEPIAETAPETRRLLTAEDLEHFPTNLPSGLIEYELFDGELITMVFPSGRHGTLEARMAYELINQGERLGYGKVMTGIGVLTKRNPDRLLGPDVSFYLRSILPLQESREGYQLTMPSIAVEIRSKNDSRPYIEKKAKAYLEAGVPCVWIVDPKPKTVTILRPSLPPEILSEQQTLTAEDIIPGFRCALVDLFRE